MIGHHCRQHGVDDDNEDDDDDKEDDDDGTLIKGEKGQLTMNRNSPLIFYSRIWDEFISSLWIGLLVWIIIVTVSFNFSEKSS